MDLVFSAPCSTASGSAPTMVIDPSAAFWSSTPGNVSHHIPPAIPREQIYYWARTWQEGEEKALADLEAGRSQVFTDPRELARYLLRPTD